MFHFIKKYSGVSLVEVMLVLFISSLIAIAAFQYQKVQNENAVATEFAERMYEYSQAVRIFADEHESELASGMAAPFTNADAPGSTFTQNGSDYIITGVDWLTAVKSPVSGTFYLPKTFSFDHLEPLQLHRTPTGAGTALIGNQAIQVDISGVVTSKPQITILYGALYDVADPSKPPAAKASITSKAAKIASALNDPLMGPSSFDYLGGGLDANGVSLPIIATIKQSTVKGESYLRLDGTNSMLDTISFDVANATHTNITGVGTLQFDNTRAGSGVITNLFSVTMLGSSTMASAGEIAGIKKITMDQTQGGVIDNVNTISFVGNSSLDALGEIKFGVPGNISGVGTIRFARPSTASQEFKGFGEVQTFVMCGDGGSGGLAQVCANGGTKSDVATGYYANHHICSLSYTAINDANGQDNKGCKLKVDSGNKQYLLDIKNALGCGVICIPYNNF